MQILRRYVMGYNPVRVQVLSDQRIHFGDRRMGGEGACPVTAGAAAVAAASAAASAATRRVLRLSLRLALRLPRLVLRLATRLSLRRVLRLPRLVTRLVLRLSLRRVLRLLLSLSLAGCWMSQRARCHCLWAWAAAAAAAVADATAVPCAPAALPPLGLKLISRPLSSCSPPKPRLPACQLSCALPRSNARLQCCSTA